MNFVHMAAPLVEQNARIVALTVLMIVPYFRCNAALPRYLERVPEWPLRSEGERRASPREPHTTY